MAIDILQPHNLLFILAGILDVIILFYSYSLSKKMGNKGYLPRMVLFSGLSVFILGIHHIAEIIFEGDELMLIFSESLETLSLIVLLVAVYQLFRLTQED